MITIAISNQKCGVGKTTIAFNLAQMLSNRRSTSVLAIDNDPQANLTISLLKDSNDRDGNILGVGERAVRHLEVYVGIGISLS